MHRQNRGRINLLVEEIKIVFHPVSSRYSPAILHSAIKECVASVEKHLRLPVTSFEIEIYGERREWIDNHTRINESELLTWVGGDSGRIIRVVADEKKVPTDAALARMVCHECVHHIVRSYAGLSIPAWLDEGLAILLVQDLPTSYLKALTQASELDGLLPVEILEQPFSRFDRSLKSLAYAQSTSLVSFLIEKFGYPCIQELLDCCRRGDRVESILRQKGFTIYLFEKEWSVWLPGYLAVCTEIRKRVRSDV